MRNKDEIMAAAEKGDQLLVLILEVLVDLRDAGSTGEAGSVVGKLIDVEDELSKMRKAMQTMATPRPRLNEAELAAKRKQAHPDEVSLEDEEFRRRMGLTNRGTDLDNRVTHTSPPHSPEAAKRAPLSGFRPMEPGQKLASDDINEWAQLAQPGAPEQKWPGHPAAQHPDTQVEAEDC